MAYTTINDPTDYFESKTYTGTTADQDITGLSFQPDFAWFKVRSEVGSHRLQDSVRGTTKVLFSNGTDVEATDSNLITSFNSDGYTLKGAGSINENTRTYVSWNWLASNSTASNTDGSITSTVSANTTSGFSIVTWTGNATASQSVGHGLGAVPKVIITKNTDNGSQPWKCYFSEVGNADYLQLNTTDEPATSGVWDNTTPSSSLIYISNDTGINGSGNTIVAYCFAEKKGFSKFGSYTGNGSADGPMVYTGFKPAFVIIKQSSASGQNWFLTDNKRNEFNAVDKLVYADSSNAEVTSGSHPIDFLSNGFKCKGTGSGNNGSGATYIYMAFAESPFTTSTGVPTTAR